MLAFVIVSMIVSSLNVMKGLWKLDRGMSQLEVVGLVCECAYMAWAISLLAR